MSFKSTGRKVTREHDERLQYCDQCGAQISIDEYSSQDHWNLWLERRVRYPDDDCESLDFCSLKCVSAWCIDTGA